MKVSMCKKISILGFTTLFAYIDTYKCIDNIMIY